MDASDDGGADAGSTLPGCSGANVPIWYQDCDGDGYSPSIANGGISSCVPPLTTTSCIAWTTRRPIDKTNTDCNDHSVAYHPGADFDFPFTAATAPAPNSTEYDLNCDGEDTLDTDANYVIFFGNTRQTVTWCPDAYFPGCCITSATFLDACCGCTLGAYIGCGSPMARGDVTAYFRCR